MARTVFNRVKTPAGAWTRDVGSTPFDIAGLTGGTVYQFADGVSALIERTPPSVVTVVNLVVNGTFVADTNWAHGPGWSIPSPFGFAVHSGTAVSGNMDQTLVGGALTLSAQYRLTYTVSNYTGGLVRGVLTAGGANTPYSDRTANGTYVEVKTLIGANTGMRFLAANNFAGAISNVILEAV